MRGPVDVVVRFLLDIDRRDWTALRAAMTDVLDVDYSSLSGGGPEQLGADALLDRWRALLPGFDATQHHLGPLATVAEDAERATLECAVRGYHRLDDREWMVAGQYSLGVERVGDSWLLGAIALHVSFVDGDGDLPAEATARVARGS